MVTARQHTCSLESQLLTDHCSIIPAPAVITDRTPDSTITDLHCPLTIALTTNQTNSTICTVGINGWKLQDKSLKINLFCHLAPKNTVLVQQLGCMYGFIQQSTFLTRYHVVHLLPKSLVCITSSYSAQSYNQL